jgi:hypothetical protein
MSARQMPATICYALALLTSAIVLSLLPGTDDLLIAQAASTNIKHLARDPLFVLPASAFVPSGNSWMWVPLSLLLLGGLERAVGTRRMLLVGFGSHVIATLLSEGLLLAQIVWHTAPRSAIDILDVGPSYLVFAALSGCLVVGSRRLRIAALLAAAIVVPPALEGISQLDMSAIGHLSALALGALLAAGLRGGGSRPRTGGRRAHNAWSSTVPGAGWGEGRPRLIPGPAGA